ncbi:hypothetical protein [Candidatus Cyanaurora vandensis]|uniref:hypothetical protein n=1 Tax=Candidatus Cyanaurora vandensis TaxID=2714958 RepID=UPI00257F9195|nr:hypothetical protein [Candidatus Cyanaurora vandensis]
MNNWQLTTPVVFFIFKRPDTTQQVFERIQQARPPQLLVVADGPAGDNPTHLAQIQATRAVVEQVDWDCTVERHYSPVNLGMKGRMASGVDWAFSRVKEAIILEDDCLPTPSFFRYCEELLKQYRYDGRVLHIAGSNYGQPGPNPRASYYFSRCLPVWGWASWRRAWQHHDGTLAFWPQMRQDLPKYLEARWSPDFMRQLGNKIYAGESRLWSVGWWYSLLYRQGFAVLPQVNLVTNLGFGAGATITHSIRHPLSDLMAWDIPLPLSHRHSMLRDESPQALYALQESLMRKTHRGWTV